MASQTRQSSAKRVVRLLEAHGGEYTAPDGKANRRLAAELDVPYARLMVAVRHLLQEGTISREGTPRRTYLYRLAGEMNKEVPSRVVVRQLTPEDVERLGLDWKEYRSADAGTQGQDQG